MFLLGFFVQFFNNVYCQLFNVSSPNVIPFSLPMKFVVLAICVLIGFITGGPLGIATIILMFGTGPLISTWNKLVSKPIVEKFA